MIWLCIIRFLECKDETPITIPIPILFRICQFETVLLKFLFFLTVSLFIKMHSIFVSRLVQNWKLIFTIVLPIVLLPLLFIHVDLDEVHDKKDVKFRAAYVILITAIFWMVEALPLPITSLIPMVLLPLLGIRDTCM